MKQLLVLSGKGGTGKTTMATALIKLSKTRNFGDCDVDAPNLHLMFTEDEDVIRTDFQGMEKAVINKEECINCGKCYDVCRFHSIEENPYSVNPYACEGCGFCQEVCPVGAISMNEDVAGDLLLYKNEHYFSTAKLKMGSGTSGKLVTEVKKQLKNSPYEEAITVVDGSPGIGCPVIASISGVDLVLMVTEPSLSGISDLKRVVKTNQTFKTPMVVCINKWDINEDNTKEIEAYCLEEGLPVVGKLPFDKKVSLLLNQGKSILEDEHLCKEVTTIYSRIMEELK